MSAATRRTGSSLEASRSCMGQIEERLGSIARLIQTDQDAKALRLHVSELLESPAFSSSRRSGQFLQYVVEKAVAQQIDALKERVIGVEVFHRQPDYDTGEDAIVRVAANEVRRRLAQHYRGEGRSSGFRISLPPGGYAPEVYRDLLPTGAETEHAAAVGLPAATTEAGTRAAPVLQEPRVAASNPAAGPWRTVRRVPLLLCGALVMLSLVAAGAFLLGRRSATAAALAAPPPWSLLFASGKPLLVVMADPDLNEIQLLTGRYVSPAEYAAGKLGCDYLRADVETVCEQHLRGDKSSTVDVAAISHLATLAGHYGSSVETLESRSLRLADLETDRNVVLFGSRVSNPWVDLFRERVDFYVGHDPRSGLQVVYNQHRRPGEAEVYVPTAGPWGSGDTYTLITFVRTLNGKGHALLLTGATHEGMEAATRFVLDPDQLSRARRGCDLNAEDAPFQLLLKLRMMAGSPLTITSITCHRLAG